MKRSLTVGLMALAVLSTGCASNQAPAGPSGSAPSAKSAGGCEPDAMKVCQAIREQPVVEAGTGLTADARRREQNSPATQWETAWYPVPNGHTLEVQCLINTQHSTVVHASFLKGPAPNDADLAFLREHGLCKE